MFSHKDELLAFLEYSDLLLHLLYYALELPSMTYILIGDWLFHHTYYNFRGHVLIGDWLLRCSGGVARNWVGVPRQYFTGGRKRCACVRDVGAASDSGRVINISPSDIST